MCQLPPYSAWNTLYFRIWGGTSYKYSLGYFHIWGHPCRPVPGGGSGDSREMYWTIQDDGTSNFVFFEVYLRSTKLRWDAAGYML
jgi:hypothetical protein